MSSPHHEDLIERLLENSLDGKSRAELLAELRTDPGLLRTLSLHLEISESISRGRPERADDTFARSTAGHILALASESENEFVSGVTRKITRRNWTKRLAVAAAIALLATLTFSIYRMTAGRSDAVADMIELDGNGQVIGRHEIQPGFRHVSGDGLFRINFNNGAIVAIEGPTDFEITSGMSMRLHSGKLNAWCPDTAHGFQVVTATGTVTDLGTSFGVATLADGSSNFVVLDGLIEVSQSGNVRRLEEGQAIRTDASPGFKHLEFKTDEFHRTWPLAAGIISTGGSVAPAPPGTAEQLSKLENNNTIFVVPEKKNVPFDRPIRAEVSKPGLFYGNQLGEAETLSPDPEMRLKSYIVRYNPTYSWNFRRFEGRVTFDRPVVAICCQGRYLDASDSMFSTGTWGGTSEEDRKFRGLDTDQKPGQLDEVRLSEDRRTVYIVFHASTSSDDIRVIVEQN